MTIDSLSFICSFCGKVCKNANSLRNHERLCKANPNRQLTSFEKHGAILGFNNKGRSAWNKGLTAADNKSLAKASETLKARYASGELVAKNPMNDPEARKKHKQAMKKANANYTRRTPGKFKYGWFNGIWCDSSWELAYLLYCIDHNISIERNKKGFSYIWQDSVHSYFPDFYLPATNQYVEIKGYKSNKDEEKIIQFKETLIVIGAAEIQPILDYVQQKYGKDFTRLYETTDKD